MRTWDKSIPKRQDQAPTEPFLRYVDGIETVLINEWSQRKFFVDVSRLLSIDVDKGLDGERSEGRLSEAQV